MIARIAAVFAIFIATTVAWVILGSTIFLRTDKSQAGLRGKVVSVWGAPHEQAPPSATYETVEKRMVLETKDNKQVQTVVDKVLVHTLPLEATAVDARLELEYRQKGLLWYSTYRVLFQGDYTFRNHSPEQQKVTFTLPFPVAKAIYDDVVVTIDGKPVPASTSGAGVTGEATLASGQAARFKVGYRSQGLEKWQYQLGNNEVSQVRGFHLKVTTNFDDVDFPDNTLSPTVKRQRQAGGWELQWDYRNLVSGAVIAVMMPEKLQPGPLAAEISYFAPVSLFFFFFLMLVITTLRRIDLHPMNYFFLAAAFFSFHLLMAYLVDLISIHVAFAICSAVSIFLVVSYLRLVVGMRFAAVEAGLTQLVYLVLFSYAFFFKGLTGLTITIGSIMTLFVVMQLTGRHRWSQRQPVDLPDPRPVTSL